MIVKFRYFESLGNEKELYHFTSIFNAIGIVDDDYITSYYGYISTTRNKFMNKFEPPNVNMGVRIVLDWNKILEDYKTESYSYSDELAYEDEEKILTRKLLNVKKYIKYIDIIEEDVQTPENIGIHNDEEEMILNLIDPETENREFIEQNYYIKCKPFRYQGVRQCYKWSERLFQKSKEFFESKGIKVNIIREVSENKIYYHGSDVRIDKYYPTKIKRGMFGGEYKNDVYFFSDDIEVARKFAEDRGGKNGVINKVNLNVEKTLDFTDFDFTESFLGEIGYLGSEEFDLDLTQLWTLLDDREFVDIIKGLGYDSVKLLEPETIKYGATSIAVLDSDKIIPIN